MRTKKIKIYENDFCPKKITKKSKCVCLFVVAGQRLTKDFFSSDSSDS